MTSSSRPDVVVLGPEWPARALLRAQLIEEGYDVVATDAWPVPRQYLRSETKPRALVIDLHGLPDPRGVLDEVRGVIAPSEVVVVTASGTVEIDDNPPHGISRRRPAGNHRRHRRGREGDPRSFVIRDF